MTRTPSRAVAVAAGCALLASAGAALLPAAAHRGVDRVPEVWTAQERLLVVDSDTGDLVVLDDGDEVERLSTPPAPISLARSDDGRHVFALRGRNTDRDHVTVIDTAYDEVTGEARRPYVARTYLAQSPGGVSDGRLPEVGGAIGVAEEGTGAMHLLDPGGLSGLGDAAAASLELAAPDHYAFAVTHGGDGREVLHAGHLRAGGVQVLDPATGRQRAWYDGCTTLHGAAPAGERVFFGCADGVLVTPADPDAGTEARLVPYPSDERVAAFHAGAGGTLWGTSEGANTVVHRIDTTRDVPLIDQVSLSTGSGALRTALATTTTPDGSRLLVLTHQGFLQIRDGSDGALLREVQLGERYDLDFHEHVDRAEAPDLAPADGHVYVSQPRGGRIVTVDLGRGRVVDRMPVAGMPTRMVLLGGA